MTQQNNTENSASESTLNNSPQNTALNPKTTAPNMEHAEKHPELEKSLDFFRDKSRDEISKAIKEARDLGDMFCIEVSYYPEEQKFVRGERQNGTWEKDPKEIVVCQVKAWNLEEDSELPREKVEKMSKEDQEYTTGNLVDEWIDQYDHDVEEAEKAIEEFFIEDEDEDQRSEPSLEANALNLYYLKFQNYGDDQDDTTSFEVFSSSLHKDAIEKILDKAKDRFDKSEYNLLQDLFGKLLKEEDPKSTKVDVQVVCI